MKKLSRVLLILFICLAGCSDNPAVRVRYEAEKKLHQMERQLSEIQSINRDRSGAQLLDISKEYSSLANYCYAELGALSVEKYPVEYDEIQYIAYQAANRKAQLYYALRYYDSSLVTYHEILRRLELPKTQVMTTYVNLGQAYQSAGKWDSAYTIYTQTAREFYPPVDDNGELFEPVFTLPLHIFQISSTIEDSRRVNQDFSAAEMYYQSLTADSINGTISAAAHHLLAKLYEITGQWEKEIAQLDELKDPVHPNYQFNQFRIATLYGDKLKRYDTALTMYDRLADQLEEKDTLLLPSLHLRKALIKIEQKKLREARDILIMLKREFPKFYDKTPMTQYSYAKTFELEKRWPRAESEYNLLIEKYRGSKEAMRIFLYIYDHYKALGQDADAAEWLRNAERYYNELASSGKGSLMEAAALLYKADLETRSDNWRGSAELLTEVYRKFPGTEQGTKAAVKAASIYRERLNEPKTADSLIFELKTQLSEIQEPMKNEDLF